MPSGWEDAIIRGVQPRPSCGWVRRRRLERGGGGGYLHVGVKVFDLHEEFDHGPVVAGDGPVDGEAGVPGPFGWRVWGLPV